MQKEILMRYFFLVISLLAAGQAAAWPWDDPADELDEATYEVMCCLYPVVAAHPYTGDTFIDGDECWRYSDPNSGRMDKIEQNMSCRAEAQRNKEALSKYNKNLVATYCGALGVEYEKRKAECLKQYKSSVCQTVLDAATARAERECK
jgi:hypothetical protein